MIGRNVLPAILLLMPGLVADSADPPNLRLKWTELPQLPDPLGVAGPFVGIHNDALVVAGGANFPKPVWDHDKVWRDSIYVLKREAGKYVWSLGGKLPRPIAYGAAVSTDAGIVCIGGNDSRETFREVFLLAVNATTDQISTIRFPSLPKPCAFGSAALVNNVIYLIGGQSDQSLDSAMKNVWSLDLAQRENPTAFRWVERSAFPGPSRALNITIGANAGAESSVYVISGRRQQDDTVQFLKDCWQFVPSRDKWYRRSDSPRCVMAGVGIADGSGRLLILGGADGSLFHRSDELRDRHPGFPRESLAYDMTSDTWQSAGQLPQNHVTTIAVQWERSIIIPSGEVRPRVRSPNIWQITPGSD